MSKLAIARIGAIAAFGAATLIGLSGGAAVADPPVNGHDCAGALVSSVAGPGFGQLVSALAHQQQVDNLGLADCGAPPRSNP